MRLFKLKTEAQTIIEKTSPQSYKIITLHNPQIISLEETTAGLLVDKVLLVDISHKRQHSCKFRADNTVTTTVFH